LDPCKPPQFWSPNTLNVRGGIELGFMSTTKDRKTAVRYVNKNKAQEDAYQGQLVFEMQMGMVNKGAPLQWCWCSQFPCEEEVLFAPLTGLEVCGQPRVDKAVIIVELRLNCNLHDRTIEEVLSKLQNSHLDLISIIRSDLGHLGFPASSWAALDNHEKRCSGTAFFPSPPPSLLSPLHSPLLSPSLSSIPLPSSPPSPLRYSRARGSVGNYGADAQESCARTQVV
jgi:hypothetical protein